MSRCEKKLKDKLDDEIKLAGLEALVSEECAPEAKFGSRIRDSKPSDTGSLGHSDPMDVDAVNSLSRLAKEKGHRVRVMGVFSAVEHIFNETAMHARVQASNRLARANRANHGPRVRAKERDKRTRENPKGRPKKPQVPKALTRVKHRKLVSQVLKTRNSGICTNMSH